MTDLFITRCYDETFRSIARCNGIVCASNTSKRIKKKKNLLLRERVSRRFWTEPYHFQPPSFAPPLSRSSSSKEERIDHAIKRNPRFLSGFFPVFSFKIPLRETISSPTFPKKDAFSSKYNINKFLFYYFDRKIYFVANGSSILNFNV